MHIERKLYFGKTYFFIILKNSKYVFRIRKGIRKICGFNTLGRGIRHLCPAGQGTNHPGAGYCTFHDRNYFVFNEARG